MCKIYIPPISRVCPTHASRFSWQNTDVVNESNDFTKDYIEDMFRLLTDPSIHDETPLVLSKFMYTICPREKIIFRSSQQ